MPPEQLPLKQQKCELIEAENISKTEPAYGALKTKRAREHIEASNEKFLILKTRIEIECKKQAGILATSGSYESYRIACALAKEYLGLNETIELVRMRWTPEFGPVGKL